jgi:Tol biopolymer transport system component
MTVRDDFDRLMTAWLDETAGAGAPDYLDETLEGISRLKQRPAWMSPGRWLPMQLTMPRTALPRAVPTLLLTLLLIAALVAAAFIVGSQQRRLPAPIGPAANGVFVFDSEGDIVITNARGTDPRPLTGPNAFDFGPAVAPDGTRIAFWSRSGSTNVVDLVMIGADGSGPQVVVSGVTPDERKFPPIWSPDSRMLAFVTSGGVLERVRADGTERLRVGSDDRERRWPRWSPDGTRLAYVVGDSSGGVVHVSAADGSRESRVGSGRGGLAEWSPDGTRLVYFAPTVPGDLIIASQVGGQWNESVLLESDADDVLPRWSNDGTRVAFLRMDGDDGGRLMVIDADGTSVRALTRAGESLTFALPCWSPDDRLVAALSLPPITSEGSTSAFVVASLDGSHVQRVPARGVTSVDACSWQRLAP